MLPKLSNGHPYEMLELGLKGLKGGEGNKNVLITIKMLYNYQPVSALPKAVWNCSNLRKVERQQSTEKQREIEQSKKNRTNDFANLCHTRSHPTTASLAELNNAAETSASSFRSSIRDSGSCIATTAAVLQNTVPNGCDAIISPAVSPHPTE